ncbi:MAG: hypothetical protein RR313_09025 [Anaerovoracaceae bacterium]
MITQCDSNGGCGKVINVNAIEKTGEARTMDIPYKNMTNYIPQVPGTVYIPEGNDPENNSPRPESLPDGKPIPESPSFGVPTNPLLPPGYQEVLGYGNLQYLNGFLRTQIGKYVKVEVVYGSTSVVEKSGYLVGVGINYIILQEFSTGNVLTIDFYSIKSAYIYYAKPAMTSFDDSSINPTK